MNESYLPKVMNWIVKEPLAMMTPFEICLRIRLPFCFLFNKKQKDSWQASISGEQTPDKPHQETTETKLSAAFCFCFRGTNLSLTSSSPMLDIETWQDIILIWLLWLAHISARMLRKCPHVPYMAPVDTYEAEKCIDSQTNSYQSQFFFLKKIFIFIFLICLLKKTNCLQ